MSDMMNNVDAPEYYDNDPEGPVNFADAKLLKEDLDIAESVLADNSPEDIYEVFFDGRVNRSGVVVLVDKQPPLIDLRPDREREGVFYLSGYYNECMDERVIEFSSQKYDELKGLYGRR